MLWSEDHVGGSEQSIGAGGEDGDGFPAGHLEMHLCALAASDPIPLPGLDAVGPVEWL